MTAVLEEPRTLRPGTRGAGRVYEGHPARGGGPGTVLVYDDDTLVGPLEHRLVRHSPTGFSWGYGGSGPAELALNLLLDALGPDAWCPGCAGGGTETYHDTDGSPYAAKCGTCRGQRTSPAVGPDVYQAFKFEYVAEWPEDRPWRIGRTEILAWHRSRSGPPAPIDQP